MSLESCVGTRGWREGTGRGRSVGGRCLSPHGKDLITKLATGTGSPSTGSSPPGPGPALGAAPNLPAPDSGSRFGPFPGGDPIPLLPFSPSGSRPPATSLRIPPASPPWRHASLAWRRSRRVAAGVVRRPRPRSISPCWAGKGRHPWRRLAGGLRGRRVERDPSRRRSREPRGRAWQ